MADKYLNKYRIPSARWATWDYGANAPYFVTICTHNMRHHFGKVKNGEMQYTPLGQSAYDCWMDIPAHFPFVVLDAFVVMPNHVHGILVFNKCGVVEPQDIAAKEKGMEPQDIAAKEAWEETQYLASVRDKWQINKFGPQSRNLASVLRGFKVGVTKFAHQNDLSFKWHVRFHDHVVRDEAEWKRIAHYIENNPRKWSEDKFYGEDG